MTPSRLTNSLTTTRAIIHAPLSFSSSDPSAGPPAIDQRKQRPAEDIDDARYKCFEVSEVDVGRRTSQPRFLHDPAYSDLANREHAHQPLGGVEDLAVGLLGVVARAPGHRRRG